MPIYVHTAKALHDEIKMRAEKISGKVYLFFDEIQEVKDWEKCMFGIIFLNMSYF